MAALTRLTPDTLDFVLLSFEGPDQYAMAGGLGVRMRELSYELARQGFRTHLIFVGDPSLPTKESPIENLTLHRWSQWLSAHYPAGVYHGEEAKLVDWNEQLPPFVASELVGPAAREGRLTAILAEEWHTAYCTCQVSDQLWLEKLRDKAIILWNANNVMGFDRIDWARLNFCSQITTVSRYMKHVMWDRGVNPLVIPNGIPSERIQKADASMVARLRAAFPGRDLIFKIGRFSPDKRWNMAIDALAEEKRRNHAVATMVRGGVEPHGMEVLHNARVQGLGVADVNLPRDPSEALDALAQAPTADIYNIASFMSDELISVLYSGADAVLANSGHEPFGLVGLEVMAAAGIAFVGATGEDYAVSYLNSVVLDTDDPSEINIALDFLRRHPEVVERMRTDAQETARNFTWENVITDNLLGKLEYVATRQLVTPPQPAAHTGTSTAAATATAPGAGGGDQTASLPYSGEAVPRRLPIKPRGPVAEDEGSPRGRASSSLQPTASGSGPGPADAAKAPGRPPATQRARTRKTDNSSS